MHRRRSLLGRQSRPPPEREGLVENAWWLMFDGGVVEEVWSGGRSTRRFVFEIFKSKEMKKNNKKKENEIQTSLSAAPGC